MILDQYFGRLETIETVRWGGTVTQMIGLLVESAGPAAAMGDFLEVTTSSGRTIRTQTIGFRDGRILSMPLEETDGLQLGDVVVSRREDALMEVGPQLLGRVVDGFGRPIDNLGTLHGDDRYELYKVPPGPLDREPISELVTGIRAIDALLPCGKGQRIGIFGGSGVGKSTLLGSMSRHNSADVTVIAMIGERNREVRAFLENELGPRAANAPSWSAPPASARRRCASAPASSPWPSPSISATRAPTCFWSWIRSPAWPWRNARSASPPANRPARRATPRRSSTCCPKSWNAPGISAADRSPVSSPSWWKATISTNPSAMPCAASWTATSSSPANSATRATTRPSTSSTPSAPRRQFRLVDLLKEKSLLAWSQASSKEQEDLAAELYLARRGRQAG
jgi:hypothetical protein